MYSAFFVCVCVIACLFDLFFCMCFFVLTSFPFFLVFRLLCVCVVVIASFRLMFSVCCVFVSFSRSVSVLLCVFACCFFRVLHFCLFMLLRFFDGIAVVFVCCVRFLLD